jgi:hypothetical protein
MLAHSESGNVRGLHAMVNGLKRKTEKKAERQDKGIDEVEEGKQGNVIWNEMLGEWESKKKAKGK